MGGEFHRGIALTKSYHVQKATVMIEIIVAF
jgi:hypothetical protein